MGILKGYVNKENNSNRIYSREDVGKMSPETFSKNEKAIDHQMRTVGVPSNSDLKNSSDVVYVAAYKRADGTEVSAYYRSRPDGSGVSSTNTGNGGGDLVPNTNGENNGGDLVPNTNIGDSIDKILNFLGGSYSGESIIPTDGKSPLDKMGSGDIVSQILNMIAGNGTGSSNENILQKILGGAKTDGANNDVISNLLNVLSGGNTGDLEKILNPQGNGGILDEKLPQDKAGTSSQNPLDMSTNPISAILDYINTGKLDVNKLLPTPNNDGGIIDENPNYPWEGQDDTKNKNSKKDKEEEKVNPLNDLLNYVTTGEFNKDQFIGHVVDSVADNELFDMPEDNDPNREMLLKLVKQNNEFIDGILDGVTNLLPEDSQITDAVKGLVQYKKNMSEQMETMLDPEKAKEQMIAETKQWLSDFTDFTGQLVRGDFENIKWDEVGQKLHISQIASMINPVAGVIATLAVDVAPKVVKLVEGINSGDKVEIIQNAIGAFTNCMGVVGQLKSAIGNKIAEFSKDVDAKIYNEATQTYDNLGQIQDAGYKYETYVKAEMFDQANQEALKLNDLSTDMMQGNATGFATNINDINVDEITTDNFEPSTVLQGGISKTEYPDVSTEVPNVQSSQTTDFGDSAIIASQISNAINSIMNNSQNASNLNVSDAPQFRASSNNLDTLLQKVTTAKNQEEYSKLLKEYAQQKEKYQKTQDLTAQLDYASQNKDYQGVTQTAKNYMQQDSGMQPANQKLTKEHYNNKLETLINNALGFQPASAEKVPTGFASGTGNVSKSSNKIPNELKKLNAVKDKFIIDQATNIGRRTGSFASGSVKNSSELWQYASQNKVIDKENVQEFSNIDQISNSNLNKFVHNKVQQQLHMNDVKGLIFKPTSSLSNLIKNSRDMHKFISDNYAKLSQGKNLQSSIKLDYNIDDWGAINRADIYNPTIDKNGTFKAVIVDTYDFNKGELNPLVKAGRNVQEAGLLKPF